MSDADPIARSTGISKANGIFHAIVRVIHLRTLDTLSQ